MKDSYSLAASGWPTSPGDEARAATLTSLRHLHAQADSAVLKWGVEVVVRFVAVPNSWVAPPPGVALKRLAAVRARVPAAARRGASPPHVSPRDTVCRKQKKGAHDDARQVGSHARDTAGDDRGL